MKLDILAIGVHPDDIELGCSGVLMMEKNRGKKIGAVDLTAGELGTRGNGILRLQEAQTAGQIMGLDIRENLGMADGFFTNDEEHQRKVISVLRKYRPEVVLCNAPEDRHPDHGRAAALVETAAFLSGLPKIKTTDEQGKDQEAWRPKYVLNYIQDRYLKPDFVLDITPVMDAKMASIQAYGSQFYSAEANNDEPTTYISTPGFLDSVVHRARMLGKMVGVDYAEGFISKKCVGIQGFDHLILNHT